MTDHPPVLGKREIAKIIAPHAFRADGTCEYAHVDDFHRALSKADAILNLLSQRRSEEETRARSQPVMALHGAIGEGEDSGGWRPIESAPDNGRRFVGYSVFSDCMAIGYFNAHSEFEQVDCANQPMSIGFYPTHWMPLPSAPVTP